MRNATSFAAALVAGLSLAAAAVAQAPPPLVRVMGTVSAITADQIVVHGADGKDTTVGLLPSWTLVTTKVEDKDAIKPGRFVATANLGLSDGVGRSVEIRLFEPGSHLGEGSRPMAQAGQMMTNATVTKATKTAQGLEIDVSYPGGTRHIIVPPDVKVIASIPTDRSALKPGAHVFIAGIRAADGALKTARIQMDGVN